MIDYRATLTVLEDKDGTWLDLTTNAADYLRDPFDFELAPTTDFLYIGLHKPFGGFYIELDEASETQVALTGEIYVDGAWTTISLNDETRGLTRSGFITWDKSDMESATINGKEAAYLRLSVGGSGVSLAIRGINIVFTDMARLKQDFFEIDNVGILPTGEASHIGVLVASRNQIVQELRNMGYQKQRDNELNKKMINQWDLLDIFEVKEAATYAALSKIFFNLSGAVDDHWWAKHKEYQDKYKQMLRVVYLSIDENDDGVADPNEKQKMIKVQRWVR